MCSSAHLASSEHRGNHRAHTAMAAQDIHLPTADELHDALAQLEGLKQTMAERQASGKSTSGRYKKVDTARKSYINTVAIPSLRVGKLVPDADWEMLLGPADDDLHGLAQKQAHKWADEHYRRPGSVRQLTALERTRQTTLLEWAERNPSSFTRPAFAPKGSPKVYRIDFGEFKGHTVMVRR